MRREQSCARAEEKDVRIRSEKPLANNLLENQFPDSRHNHCSKDGIQRTESLLQLMRIERILCPIDLTPGSEAALRYEATLARAIAAQLIVMYCEADAASPQSGLKDAQEILDA